MPDTPPIVSAVANPFDLTGRVAVVTGGNSGIGKGMAEGLARAGADVAIWSRNAERNQQAAYELSKYGARVVDVVCEEVSSWYAVGCPVA